MVMLGNAQVKALQLLDLAECIENAIDDAATAGGAFREINKAMNLVTILGEQLSDLVGLLEAEQKKGTK